MALVRVFFYRIFRFERQTRLAIAFHLRFICRPMKTPQAASLGWRKLRSCRAFTILEVGLAAAIMAMGISTSITVMQRGFVMLDSARNLTTAGQILVSQMEQLRMYDWTTITGYATGADTPLDIDRVFVDNASVGSRFSLTRNVTAISADMRQITYTIRWRSYDGRNLSRSMMTYYAHYGIHDYFYNQT